MDFSEIPLFPRVTPPNSFHIQGGDLGEVTRGTNSKFAPNFSANPFRTFLIFVCSRNVTVLLIAITAAIIIFAIIAAAIM